MKVHFPLKNVIHFEMPSQYVLTMTFVRLQEFYESPYPDINGKYFSLEKYMDVYADDTGNFTYSTDWSGFNVPSDVYNNWLEMFCYDLRKKEVDLVLAIREKILSGELDEKFYIIGTYEEGKGTNKRLAALTIKHELSHALWYLNTDYQRRATKLIRDFPKDALLHITNYISDKGYVDDVIHDEVVAYMSTSDEDELQDMLGDHYDKHLAIPFQELFKEFNNEMGNTKHFN